MSESDCKPLLTFAVVAFNTERFIEAAIEGAFAQTYTPLEIILSDDCSEDGTFEIMRKKAVTYQGPHRVILNRNPVRRSIAGHINRVVALSHGELIVGSAGDDVSLPERTQIIYEAWEQSARQATSISSDYIQIDEAGREIKAVLKQGCVAESPRIVEQNGEPVEFVRTLQPSAIGCAYAFSPRLFALFGGIPEDIIHEDEVLAFRTILAGRMFYIDERLVQYRLHGNNLFLSGKERPLNLKSLARYEDRARRVFRTRETMYAAFLSDLQIAKRHGFIASVDFEKTAKEIVRLRGRFSVRREYFESGILRRFALLWRLKGEGISKMEARNLGWRLIPRALFLCLKLVQNFFWYAWDQVDRLN